MAAMELGYYHLLSGSTGRLIFAAVKNYPREDTRQWLAESAGLSAFSAGRAAATLLQIGLLTEGRRGVVWNKDHEWAPELERAVYLTTGVTRASDDLGWEMRPAGESVLIREGDVPPSVRRIHRGYQSTLLPTIEAGPEAHRARGQADAIRVIGSRAQAIVSATDSAYYRWHNERFRDAIHATLGWTSFTQAAVLALDETAGTPAATTGWVRATHWLIRLHRDLDWWITTLDESVKLGREARMMRTRKNDGPESDEADELMDRYRRRLWWIGGTPGPDVVGQGGDQLMAAITDELLAHVELTVHDMTRDTAYQSWSRAYRDEAAAHPVPAESTRIGERPPPQLPELPALKRAADLSEGTP